jgi:hypothetical protein
MFALLQDQIWLKINVTNDLSTYLVIRSSWCNAPLGLKPRTGWFETAFRAKKVSNFIDNQKRPIYMEGFYV